MGIFISSEELRKIEGRVAYLDREIGWNRERQETDRRLLDRQKEQIETLKHRLALTESILMNLLARNVNCIVGWDYYLDRLHDIRKDDPDRNHCEPEEEN